jgi:hypothetical protein
MSLCQPIVLTDNGLFLNYLHNLSDFRWDQDDLDTEDLDLVYDLFMKNFNRAYNGNTRAPIGLYLHSAWFVGTNSWHFEGTKEI